MFLEAHVALVDTHIAQMRDAMLVNVTADAGLRVCRRQREGDAE
jgi:hypothetical protein